jgi:hypothetical protein
VTQENLITIINKLEEEELGKRIKDKDLGVDIHDEVK